jgi:hypothetical protein
VVLFVATAASWTLVRRTVPTVPESDRFEEIKNQLPDHGTVGYLSDVNPPKQLGAELLYLAEYSLAPLVLEPGTDRGLVLGNFADPSAAADLVERSGLEIVRRYDAGVLLLRRKPR